jgi:hypothetical protein
MPINEWREGNDGKQGHNIHKKITEPFMSGVHNEILQPFNAKNNARIL